MFGNKVGAFYMGRIPCFRLMNVEPDGMDSSLAFVVLTGRADSFSQRMSQ